MNSRNYHNGLLVTFCVLLLAGLAFACIVPEMAHAQAGAAAAAALENDQPIDAASNEAGSDIGIIIIAATVAAILLVQCIMTLLRKRSY